MDSLGHIELTHLGLVLYTHNEKQLSLYEVVGGVYWFHSVRPSVRPSVHHRQFRDECQQDSAARGKHLPEICHRTRCATCCIFKEDFEFRSTITGRKYNIINKRDCELDCTTDNLIYLIECTNCHIQYIGETSQPLSGRFSDHKSRIRNHNATKKDTVKPLTSSHPKCCVKVASQKGWPLMRGGHCAIIGTHVLVCVGRYAWFCVM